MCDMYITKDNWEKHFVNNQQNCFIPMDTILKTGQHIKRAKYKRNLFDLDNNSEILYRDRFKRNINIDTRLYKKLGIKFKHRITNLDSLLVGTIHDFMNIGWITTSSCIGHFSNKTDFYDKDCRMMPNESPEDFKKRSYLGSVLSEPQDDDLAFFHIDFLEPHPEMKDWDFVINEKDYTIFHKHKKMTSSEIQSFCIDKALKENEIWCCLNEDCTSLMAWCPKVKEAIYPFHRLIKAKIKKYTNSMTTFKTSKKKRTCIVN